MRRQIKNFIEYINPYLPPKEQIKYEIGLFRNDFNHFDRSAITTSTKTYRSSAEKSQKKHIKFEREYDYSHVISRDFNFKPIRNRTEKFLYPIGYSDSNKYLIFEFCPIYNSNNAIFAVIYNLLIRSNSISASYYLQSKNYNQHDMERIFAYELMLLYFACYKDSSDEIIFGIPENHFIYAQQACNDILYYSHLLSNMAGEPVKEIKVAVLDDADVGCDDEKIYIKDTSNNIMIGQISENANQLDCGPIITGEYINYVINTKNISSYELILRELFGKESFREGQISAISSILNGNKNHIVILPTGYGKSLIYQFLAMIQPKVSVVVSPTFILIHDQLENLKDMGISRAFHEDGKHINRHQIKYGILSYSTLVYSTPEEIQGECYFELLRQLESTSKLGYINIDECHQMSVWGHSFKAEYFTLIKQLFTEVSATQFLLFSATSSLRVKEDLREQFVNKDLKIIQPCPLERDNIHYTLINTDDLSEVANDLLRRFEADIESKSNFDVSSKNSEPSMSIILCNDEEIREMIYNQLTKSETIRRYVTLFNGEISTYNRFRLANKRIIITNDTYLAGINILFLKNIIFVGMPPSKEWLYQESGRVGRNGEHSDVLIYLSEEEKRKTKLLCDTSYTTVCSKNNIKKLRCANLDSVFSFIPTKEDINESNFILKDIKNFVHVPSNSQIGTVAGTMDIKDKCRYDKPLYYLYQLGIIDRWLIHSSASTEFSSEIVSNEIKYRFFINMQIDDGTVYFENEFEKKINNQSFNSNIQKEYNERLIKVEDMFDLLIETFAHWISENVFLNKTKMLKGTFELVTDIGSLSDEKAEMILCKYFGNDSDSVIKLKSTLSSDKVYKSILEIVDKIQKKIDFKHILGANISPKNMDVDKNKSDIDDYEKKDIRNIDNIYVEDIKNESFSILKEFNEQTEEATIEKTERERTTLIESNNTKENLSDKQTETQIETIDSVFDEQKSVQEPFDIKNNQRKHFVDNCRRYDKFSVNVLEQFVKELDELDTFEDCITWSSYFEREDEYKENINLQVLIAIIELKVGTGQLSKTGNLFRKLPVSDIYNILDSIESVVSRDVKKEVDSVLKSCKMNKYYYSGILGIIKYLFDKF